MKKTIILSTILSSILIATASFASIEVDRKLMRAILVNSNSIIITNADEYKDQIQGKKFATLLAEQMLSNDTTTSIITNSCTPISKTKHKCVLGINSTTTLDDGEKDEFSTFFQYEGSIILDRTGLKTTIKDNAVTIGFAG